MNGDHGLAFTYNETFKGQKSLVWNNTFIAETINNSYSYYTDQRIAEVLDLQKKFIIPEMSSDPINNRGIQGDPVTCRKGEGLLCPSQCLEINDSIVE